MVLSPELDDMMLQIYRYSLQKYIAKEMLEDRVTSLAEVDHFCQAFVLTLRTKILGRPLGVISYPSDWWQAFKDRWFPGWMKRRWPVERTSHEVRDLYPSMPIPPHTPVRVVMTKMEVPV